MKPCTGCKHLNDQYHRGPICRIGHEELPNDPLTGKRMVRIGFVSRCRAKNGHCGPEATKYEDKFWKALMKRLRGKA